MRIAFDLDGTLIPMPGSAMATEPRRLLPWLISRDPIRQGAPMLLRQLRGEGHELWVYTTSLRGPIRLGLWFATFGVQLDGIVNSARHSAVMAQHAIGCSKYPPAFGIDLLVDDAEGVSMEGERFGFSVLRLFGDDASWCAAVKNAAGGCLLSGTGKISFTASRGAYPKDCGTISNAAQHLGHAPASWRSMPNKKAPTPAKNSHTRFCLKRSTRFISKTWSAISASALSSL